MSDCCSPEPSQTDACGCAIVDVVTPVTHCPTCQQKGKVVSQQTVKAQVTNLENVYPVAYRFCASADCPTVYFSTDTSHQLTQADLRERVHQKAQGDDSTLVCYCFQHSPASIRAEFAAGITDVSARITALTKADRCACDIRNPQGSCCLGNVRKVVLAITKQVVHG